MTLKEIRLSKGISKNKIIRETNLTRYIINTIENGGNIGVKHLQTYCDYLKIKINYESKKGDDI